MSHLAVCIRDVLLAAGPGYLPERASSVAPAVDHVFAFLFWVSAFFLALIVSITVVFVVRYRSRPSRREPDASPSHDNRLELLWSAIPLALVIAMFAASTRVYFAMTELDAGDSPFRVQVTGRKWSWWFDHPGGKGANQLHLVAGKPTELVLASTDVIHSLYVPAFRLKQDAVPGRFTKMVFTPTQAGTYPILCAEYCGTNHSTMSAVAVVHPDQASFDEWAKEGVEKGASLVEVGQQVYGEKGCSACHSVDGTSGVGPSFKGIWGKEEKLADGKTVKVDEAYIRESIVTPDAKIRAGFDNVMPPIPLEEREIQGVVAYIQSLRD
ncbi:MAG TPA: cytochrome c oxidase subunit II [Anaeromyxobacteraceae bacterium]|nr:cytochrome c oxidase subunit II [Anaeromyxobacteraceae bacterium]